MSASTLHLLIEQGATFSQVVAVGASYDGRTARATLRDRFGGAVLATFACSAVSGGNVTVSLTAAETAALVAPAYARRLQREVKLGVWDLELVNGATVDRVRQGEVTLSQEATA